MITSRISLLIGFILLQLPVMQAQKISLHIEGGANKECKIAYYLGDKQYLLSENLNEETVKDQIVVLDANGEGIFENKTLKPGIYMLVFPPENNYIEFVFEGRDLELYTNMEEILDDPRNSVSNQLKAQFSVLNKRQKELVAAEQQNPTEKGKDAIDKLTDEYHAFLANNRSKYPDNMFLNILKVVEVPEIPKNLEGNAQFYFYRDHFFDTTDFNEEWLIRTPVISAKVNEYMNQLTVQHPDSIISSLDYIFSKSENNRELYQYLLSGQLNIYAKSKIMGFDKIYHHIAMNYYATGRADWMEESRLAEIVRSAKEMEGTFVGDKAKNFSGTTTDGATLKISEINAEYTVLFFMDPDCGHCKDASEELINIRDEIPPNVEIIGVVFNTSMEETKKFKTERGYFWTCILPSEFYDLQLRKDYNLRSFPIVYILDTNKRIIAKRISVEQIPSVIANRK